MHKEKGSAQLGLHVGEAIFCTIFGVCSGTSVTSSESGKDADKMLASAMMHP
jgi:hypothetical protein